jgi:hypothetical protein
MRAQPFKSVYYCSKDQDPLWAVAGASIARPPNLRETIEIVPDEGATIPDLDTFPHYARRRSDGVQTFHPRPVA